MKYGLVVCVLLAGCFGAPAPTLPSRHVVVPAPRVLRPLILKPGQWARYRERDAHGELGEVRFEALATESCGTWVQVRVSGNRRERSWLLCVSDDGSAPRDQIARALLDDDRDDGPRAIDPANPQAYAAELDALATRIVAPSLAGHFGREDVSVPAGFFEQTLRIENGDAATWIHTLVPFAGVVKIREPDGREDVLEDFGDLARELPHRFVENAYRVRRRRGFAAFGVGFGRSSESTLTSSTTGTAWAVVSGWHVSRTLDVIAQGGRLSTDAPTLSVVGGGVRWNPFRRATNACVWIEPYVQAVVGYAALGDGNGHPYGVGTTASAGWLAEHDGDWGLAVQLDVLGATLGSRHEAVGAVALGMVVQLELR